MGAAIRVEGWREFQAAVRKATDSDLPKRLGEVNKQIGQLVISRLQPQPNSATVGAGGGATVRPSATRREVILRVGGSRRVERADERHTPLRVQQWGNRSVNPPASGRPNIIGTALAHQGEIEKLLLDGIERALKPPFD